MPLLGFTGDTSPEGLDANPDLYEAKVLITEMSFVAPGHRKTGLGRSLLGAVVGSIIGGKVGSAVSNGEGRSSRSAPHASEADVLRR